MEQSKIKNLKGVTFFASSKMGNGNKKKINMISPGKNNTPIQR